LLEVEEIAARDCQACQLERGMWENIIEATGNAEWGYRAFKAFEDESYIEFPPMPGFNLIEWESVKIVRGERNKLKAQAEFHASQDAKRASSQTGGS